MNRTTRWNPFKSLATADSSAALPSTFDDFFRGFGLRPAWRDLDALPDIRIEVSEDDKSYQIKADLPGMKKQDIHISIEGRQVEISATSAKDVEKKDASCLYTERSEGQVYRSFTLPLEVDSEGAEARYDSGVLDLTLPKKSNGNGHRIAVS